MGIARPHPRHAPFQMCLEGGMRFPVLTLRPQASAICQNCFEAVIAVTRDIRSLIHNQTRKMLAYSEPHDTGLAVIHPETLLQSDRRDMCRETLHTSVEL